MSAEKPIKTASDETAGQDIAKRRQTYTAAFFEDSVDGALALDRQGQVVDANKVYCRMTGYRRDELLELHIADLEVVDSPERIARRMADIEERGAELFETRHRRKNGTVFDVELSAVWLGEPMGQFVCFCREITARKAAEQRLLKQQYYLDTSQKLGKIGSWELDLVEGTLHWTDENCRIFGVPPGTEATDEIFIDKVHPEDRQYVDTKWQAALTGEPYDIEHRLLIDGETTWVREKADLILDEKGAAVSAIGFTQDITARKAAEAELRANEQRHRELLSHLSAGVIVHGRDTEIVTANLEAGRLLGLSVDEMEGKETADGVWRFLRDDGSELPLAEYPVEIVRATKRPLRDYIVGIMRPGAVDPMWVLATAIPEFDTAGAVENVIVTCVEITALKKSEAENRALSERLAQVQRLESVGRLAGGVAHDFNNMLGVILGHSEMVLDELSPTSEFYEDVHEIRKAAKRSADLTKQLLAFARRQMVSPRLLLPNETIEGMFGMLRSLIGENIRFSFIPGTEVWPISIDPSQMDQILTNLCTNARDAIDGTGSITIETENVSFSEPPLDAAVDIAAGDYVQLSVSDDGRGVDKEALPSIFEPFFTTKEIGEGTGLGLATVYGIVHQAKGTITVSSVLGKGTTFKIFFPRCIEDSHTQPSNAAEHSLPPGRGTILLVEDEPALLRITHQVLTKHGYEVIGANDGAEAIELAKHHAGQIDLLLTDLVMPEMNGVTLAGKVTNLVPGAKVLYMSGYSTNVNTNHGIELEGVNFIAKPFDKVQLLEEIQQLIEAC